MSSKVTKLVVGKGKTTSDEKAGKWLRRYYEVEASITDEQDIEIVKANMEGLIDGWLTGTSQATDTQTESAPCWDPAKIKWEQAEGASGLFERSEDADNPDFKALLKDLQQHKGKLSREHHFYWLFSNSSTVGRKQTGKKKLEPSKLELEKVANAFPPDVKPLLAFDKQADAVIIKPKQFLGSENFAKVASIVRGLGGEFVSAGKNSHFKVPSKRE